jgi:hypothetical protein
MEVSRPARNFALALRIPIIVMGCLRGLPLTRSFARASKRDLLLATTPFHRPSAILIAAIVTSNATLLLASAKKKKKKIMANAIVTASFALVIATVLVLAYVNVGALHP